MDGLVSNTALVAGVAGGGAEPRTVLLAGLAGLAAGAFSMATGEYVSVASQTELTRAEIEIEKAEIRRVPQAEEDELAAIYRSRGVDAATAAAVARQLSADPEQVWRVHAREELGVDPDDLPSPWTAALSSFGAFTVGALVPVLPYLLGGDRLLCRCCSPAGAVRRGRARQPVHRPQRGVQRRAAAAARRRRGRA